MFQDITIEDVTALKDKKKLVMVDVRSPSEYKESTIPGSINIPLFDDDERKEIGTLYKQVGVSEAKERGLEIVSAKLPSFIKQFISIEGDKAVFCWRGGMRSRTSATVLDLMGIRTYRIHGGIRSYRKWVLENLESLQIKAPAYVLNGYTGTGKTKILHLLKKEGYPFIDLEGLAGHRGSIFGQIGLEPKNQKMFDALLVEEVLSIQNAPFILLEAESRRIGKVIIPEFVFDKKEQGKQIFIEMPVEERVKHILEDYQPWDHHEESIQAFQKIKKRIHTPIAAQIENALESGQFESAVELLLTYYYDPRYDFTKDHYPKENIQTIKAANAEDALQTLKELLPPLNQSVPVV
ncbi:tRNA 2-selenouridine(34) synthase MnmH [Peribacillus deserti]|uniref:tRNA 2-selenouridine(34) synthase MnmH n=1 Tax=Peribacillus deserti TaxID=673318 RepID=A0A2N5M1J1_9BACI|nr:tRNA 2-selenouridine(34) synthase MnmH [Peribacillus deserti]PLT28238.1 tRNA 2-selenouridine(34) synthase MnmH [Peribacillus deserti]